MAFSKTPTVATGFKPKNKLRRQAAFLNIKKNRESEKRDMRHKRKREESKNEALREERLKNNVPLTIDAKRVWDEPVGDDEDALGWAVDVERLAKKRKMAQEAADQLEEESARELFFRLEERLVQRELDEEAKGGDTKRVIELQQVLRKIREAIEEGATELR